MRPSEIRRFRSFMKERGAYELFKRRFKENREKDPLVDSRITCYYEEVEADGVVVGAFVWDETEEGHSFWSKLYWEWTGLIRKKRKGGRS